jgi:hypothetical protein
MEEAEVRAIAQDIVNKAKATARVDQGTLKRSIAYTYVRGKVTFRQIYYGQYRDNSELEELASSLMPRGIPYRVELTEFGGGTFEKGKTKQGRSTQRKALARVNRSTSKNINALIESVKRKRERDGEKEK